MVERNWSVSPVPSSLSRDQVTRSSKFSVVQSIRRGKRADTSHRWRGPLSGHQMIRSQANLTAENREWFRAGEESKAGDNDRWLV
jgi:hypothetical protein